jgi:hypothetical protein
MNNGTLIRGGLAVLTTAATVLAGSLFTMTRSNAHAYRHHSYRAFGSAYGHGGPYRVHMYAADHYYARPIIGGSRVNNNFNPDFQLGGGYGGQQ